MNKILWSCICSMLLLGGCQSNSSEPHSSGHKVAEMHISFQKSGKKLWILQAETLEIATRGKVLKKFNWQAPDKKWQFTSPLVKELNDTTFLAKEGKFCALYTCLKAEKIKIESKNLRLSGEKPVLKGRGFSLEGKKFSSQDPWVKWQVNEVHAVFKPPS